MKTISLTEGIGRVNVRLSTQLIGEDLIVFIFNKGAHLGAVAVADFSREENRASTSVITRLGHKDDSIAYAAAYRLCKKLKKPVCAIVGIHLDNITDEEIVQITENCHMLVKNCIQQLSVSSSQ
jgi:hypothetical protein